MTAPAIFPERAHVALPCGCRLGEGPVWDERTGTLLFVDIKTETLLVWRAGQAEPRPVPVGQPIGFVLLTDDPDVVVVGLRSELARLHLASGQRQAILAVEADRPGNRLNDGTVGPDGSIYCGSMDENETAASGRFYHCSLAGLRPFGPEVAITNGPAIDPVRRVLYTTDTLGRVIRRHRLDPDGTPGAGDIFVSFSEADGHPDGATVDAESHLWVCHYGAARVTRYSPDGDPVLVVPMPTAQVTKPAFGGPALETLYVTSAAAGRDVSIDPLAGHLFAIETGIRGLPAARCRLLA